MKEGDIIRWKGVNREYSGTLTQSEQREWLVRMDNGNSFHLDDLRYSISANIQEVCIGLE